MLEILTTPDAILHVVDEHLGSDQTSVEPVPIPLQDSLVQSSGLVGFGANVAFAS